MWLQLQFYRLRSSLKTSPDSTILVQFQSFDGTTVATVELLVCDSRWSRDTNLAACRQIMFLHHASVLDVWYINSI